MKTNIKGGKRTPQSMGLSLPNIKISLVLTVLYIIYYIVSTQPAEVYIAQKEIVQEAPKPKTEKQVIVQKIAEAFPNNKEVMVAIALEESGLNNNAVNYNCRYKIGGQTYDKLTHLYIDLNTVTKERKKGYVSTWCRKGHEKYAWSMDGSLFQINGYSKLTVDESIEKAQEKYNTQGLNAWVSYSTGRYQKHLAEAKKLLQES